MSSSGGGASDQPPPEPNTSGGSGAGSSDSPLAGVGAPIPASLLGPGMALSAALGEAGVGEGEEADMGRLQVLNNQSFD